jgi:hypothetical protein
MNNEPRPVEINDFIPHARAFRLVKDRLDDIWIATFGAAYADSVRDAEDLADRHGSHHREPGGYATALDFARARGDVERAMVVANDACRKALAWFNDGNGHPVDEPPMTAT